MLVAVERMADPREVGAYLRERRRKSGLTQRAAAELVGMANADISRIENGERIGPKRLVRMASAYGIPLAELAAVTGIPLSRLAAFATVETDLPATDPLSDLAAALVRGQWAADIREGLLQIARATRPGPVPAPASDVPPQRVGDDIKALPIGRDEEEM